MNRTALVPTLSLLAACCLARPPVLDLGLLPGDGQLGLATNAQQEHAAALGGDQYLVVWTDYRARSSGSQTVQSDGDIFGIRLDASGNPIDPAPFLIAGGMGLQQRPRVAWNGENWLVLYLSQDPVGLYFEDQLRAVRVSSQGAVLDHPPILFPPTQFTPNTIGLQLAGQAGQWLVTRCIYHSDGYGTFLAGQRIQGDGQLIDSAPVMLIDWVYGATTLLAADGEYLAVGPDWNNAASLKARRVGLNGQPQGTVFNVPGLTMATNGSEYYVVWVADFDNLVGSRMTSTGTLLTPQGTPLVSGFTQFTHATMAYDGINWWVEWGASDVLRTLRIDAAGVVLDPGGGVLLPIEIGGSINTAYAPLLAPRPGGGVSLFWYDSRVAFGYDTNVFELPISAENQPSAESCVSTSSPSQRNPSLTVGPAGLLAVAWVSDLANDDRVLAHLLAADGTPLASDPIVVHGAPTIGRTGIAWNGSLFLVAWDEGASGASTTQIRARRMHADGTFLDAEPFAVMPGASAAAARTIEQRAAGAIDAIAVQEDGLRVDAEARPGDQEIPTQAARSTRIASDCCGSEIRLPRPETSMATATSTRST